MASSSLNPASEVAMKLRLSRQAQENLAQQAAASGRDVAEVASDLLERAATRATLDEILAPVQADFARSGMSEQQIVDLGRGELEALRRERKVKRT